MAIMQIFADQIKRCENSYTYGGSGANGFSWSDVTNDASTVLDHTQDSNQAYYSTAHFLQFRIPAAALTGFSISSVKLLIRCMSLNRACPVYVYVKDMDEFETGAGSIVTGSIASTGWFEKAITAAYNSEVANKSGVWYVQVRIPQYAAIAYDTLYEARINTLNGDYDPYIEIEYTPEPCVAPTLDALAAVVETNPVLSGSGASGDQFGNKITGYEIQYAESTDGETWGDWAAEKTVETSESSFSTSVVISPTRGIAMKWRVRTLGEAGEDYYSGWVESGAVRRNSVPSAPVSCVASPVIYESGGVTVSWPAASDIDGNIAAYELQRVSSSDGSAWSDWADVDTDISAISFVDGPAIPRGEYVKYRVRAKDTFGVTGGYVETTAVRRNQIPAPAIIHSPQADQTIYNARPRLLVTLGEEPDGQLQTLTAAGYTASSSGPYPSGKQLVLRKTVTANAGTVSAAITPKDSQEVEGASESVDTTYAVPAWTEEIVAGATRIKASHINELRNAIDVVRSYYGLSAYGWSETITAGQTSMRGWSGHMAELRDAIDEVIARVNGWDSTASLNKIPQPTWAALSAWPEAASLTQIRTAIAQLQR